MSINGDGSAYNISLSCEPCSYTIKPVNTLDFITAEPDQYSDDKLSVKQDSESQTRKTKQNHCLLSSTIIELQGKRTTNLGGCSQFSLMFLNGSDL